MKKKHPAASLCTRKSGNGNLIYKIEFIYKTILTGMCKYGFLFLAADYIMKIY